MTRDQADLWLREQGFPGLFLSKQEGFWYLLGDEGVVNVSAERNLYVVRLADLTASTLRWKLDELTKEQP